MRADRSILKSVCTFESQKPSPPRPLYISLNVFAIVHQKVSNSSGVYFSTEETSRAWKTQQQHGLEKLQLYLDCLHQIIGVGGEDTETLTEEQTLKVESCTLIH